MALQKVTKEFVDGIRRTHKLHHSASDKNYVGKDCYAKAAPYKGYFGEGWKIYFRNPYGRNSCFVEYYVKED